MSPRDRTVLILLLIGGVLQLGDAGDARAACDVIPSASTQFAGARGTLGTPFAGPGDWVDVRVSPLCEGAGGGLTGAVGDYAVAIVFTPPAGPRTLRVLAESCAAFTATIPACEVGTLAPGGACCREVATRTTSEFPRLEVGSDANKRPRLRFAFPDTDDSLGSADDDVTLTGAAIIAVLLSSDAEAPLVAAALHAGRNCASTSGIVACIDDLFEPDGSCTPAGRDRTFGSFTALPPSNSYVSLCRSDQLCTAEVSQLRFTVDADGNVLAPLDWEDILRSQRGVPVPIQLRFSTPLQAFDGSPSPVYVPNRDFVGSYDVKGRKLAPVFDPQLDSAADDDLVLFGTADAPRSVIRIARHACGVEKTAKVCRSDADCVAPSTCVPLFDFSRRLESHAGPIVLTAGSSGSSTATFEAEALDPVPLEGLIQSEDLNAFAVSEPLALKSLNGDPDVKDLVIDVSARASGLPSLIGRHGARGRAVLSVVEGAFGAPVARTFRAPALVAEGNLVAFLESEPGQWNPNLSDSENDPNGNKRVADGLVRIYRVGDRSAEPLVPGDRAADSAPRINGRSLTISDGRVFYRRSEAGEAKRITERVSRGPTGQELVSGASRPAISANGRFVGFHTADQLFGTVDDASIDYFRRDLTKQPDDPGFVELISADPDGNEGGGRAGPQALSRDGNRIVFASPSALDPKDRGTGVFWRDISSGRTRRLASGDGGAISPGGTTACFTSPVPGDPGMVDLTTKQTTTYPRGTNVFAETCAVADANALLALVKRCQGGMFCFITAVDLIEKMKKSLLPGAMHLDAAVSADGRFITTASLFDALVDGDTNAEFDVFLFDRKSGAVDRVSIASDGRQADALSVSPHMSDDGRWISFVSYATNLVPDDSNGQLDVFVHDRITGVTERVSVTTAGAETTATELGWRDDIIDAGLTSVARDGIVAFQRSTDHLVDDDTNGVDDVFVRRPDPTDVAHDLFADGALDDVVLEVFAGTQATTLCPAEDVAVAAGRAAFLRPESAGETAECLGGTLNDDHGPPDVDDLVVQLWRGPGPHVENLQRAATAVAISNDFVAALVSEAGEGQNLNRDADRDDQVVELYSLSTGWLGEPPFPAAEELRFCGDDAAAFISREETNLNGDRDRDDRVLGLVTVDGNVLGPAFHLGQAVEDFVCSGSLLAMRTSEAAQRRDLNGDGDQSDHVLQVYDLARDECRRGLATGCLRNTGKTIVPCNRPGCDPRVPYRVLEHTVRFLTLEDDEGQDLNEDGDKADVVLQVFNAAATPMTIVSSTLRTAAVVEAPAPNVLAAAPAGACSNTGDACVGPSDCTDNGQCIVPPGACTIFGAPCDRHDQATECGDGFTCGPPEDDPNARCSEDLSEPCPGNCRKVTDPCGVDADCQGGGVCLGGGPIARSLVSPLVADPTGGSVLVVSSGRCNEDLGEDCTCGESYCPCSAGGTCDGGICVRFHGTCRADADCPPTMACKQTLVSASAADTDGDEIPDPIDNCPHDANPDQTDTNGDGFGDACSGCFGEACTGCPVEPDDCGAAATASLAISSATDKKLHWDWHGAGSLPSDLETGHHVCLYTRVGAEWTLRSRASIPGGGTCDSRSCWQATRTTRLRYKNPTGGMNGITSLDFRRSTGRLAIALRASGPELALPALPLDADEVSLQLRNSAGACWSSTFTKARVDDEHGYRASSH